MAKNIVLIGYRATGKTTVGRLIAQRLGWMFVDTDVLIEQRAKKKIAEIVAQEGWQGFRRREKEIIAEVSAKKNMVIAVGGGAVINKENVKNLKQNGILIWLKANADTIAKRLAQDEKTASQRPSLTGKSVVEEIEEVLSERLPLYQQAADIEVDTERYSPEEIARLIIKNESFNQIETIK